jgi:16S rRNA (guanine527-N7)-methyltransferase
MGSTPAESSQLIVNKYVNSLPPAAVGALTRYLTEVLTWTREIALVSRRDPVGTCERLLLESLEIDRLVGIAADESIVDIGSGAGFPGAVWAIAHPNARVFLIERRERKAAFLERLVRSIPLPNVEVFVGEARAAARTDAHRRRYSLAVAMAVGAPLEIADEVEGLLAPAARFVSTIPGDARLESERGSFTLVSATSGQYGRYALYHFEVS